MKKIVSLVLFGIAASLAADVVVWSDHFKKCDWTASDKKAAVSVSGGKLTTSAGSWFIGPVLLSASADGRNLAGTKLKFMVEAKGTGAFQIGVWNYQRHIRPAWSEKFTLTDQFREYAFEYTLTEKARQVRCILKGAAEIRSAKLINVVDQEYSITAEPPYQMFSGTPTPIKFTLKKNGVPVPDARIVVNGTEAYDPASGVTAIAYAEPGDTAAFDAYAKRIKLDAPIKLLYIGDSLTHFDEGRNHADKVAFFLNKFNPGKVTLYNYAVRGDDSATTVSRMRGKIDPKRDRFAGRFNDFFRRQYDVAFIFLGHNDSRAHSKSNYTEPFIKPERQKKAYRDLVAILRKQGVRRIIIISCASLDAEKLKAAAEAVAKTGRPHARYGTPEFIERFNATARESAEELHVEYMDIHSTMKAMPDKNSLFRDGAHFNDKGHDFLALETLKYLAEHPEK